MTSDSKRRGRPSRAYKASWGAEIHGLYQIPGQAGRWRIVATGERFTEHDERRAVQKFRDWQARQNPSHTFELETLTQAQIEEHGSPALAASIDVEFDEAGNTTFVQKVADAKLWAWMREQLIERPEIAAKMTGLPELANWRHMDIPKAPLSLAGLLDIYQQANAAKPATKAQTALVWDRFTRITGATDLGGLTTERLLVYRHDIETNVASPNTRKFHFSKVRTVIAFGLKMGLDTAQIRAALDRCKVLWTGQRAPAPKPAPISRDDFHALLKATEGNPWQVWRPWLLVGLNFAMHIGEVCQLKWDEIDLDNNTYVSIRGKTEAHRIPRAATLWTETAEALGQLPRKSPFVFTSHYGTAYNRNKRVNTFREFANAAKLTDITFDSLRDGAFTAAVQHCPDERWARLLAGHRSPGLQDNYVMRHPAIVKPACDAVYQVYGPFPITRASAAENQPHR